MLLLLSIITNYTGKLLRRCLDAVPGATSFPDLGMAAFGVHGRFAISILFFAELFSACAMFLILMADHLHALFPAWTRDAFLLLSAAIVLPTALTSHLSVLSLFSLVGMVSSLFLLLALVIVGGGGTQPGSYVQPAATHTIGSVDHIPIALGLVMVGFAGHAVFPSLYASMRSPHHFPRVLDAVYVLVVAVYAGIAVLGYLMYGDGVDAEVPRLASAAGRGGGAC